MQIHASAHLMLCYYFEIIYVAYIRKISRYTIFEVWSSRNFSRINFKDGSWQEVVMSTHLNFDVDKFHENSSKECKSESFLT